MLFWIRRFPKFQDCKIYLNGGAAPLSEQDVSSGEVFKINTSFYTAAVGALSQQRGLEVTANNIANLSTNGYKPDKASFADLVYTNVRNSEPAVKVGHGDALWKTDTVYSSGGLKQTSNMQDYALTSDNAFFAVRDAGGTVKYTRDGSFRLSRQRDGSFLLCNTDGAIVLDRQGMPITVRDRDARQPVGVFTFRNRDGLVKTGGNLYEATAVSGPAAPAENAEVRQGYVEVSTVNLADEISEMMTSQRAFEFDSKMVKISDEVMQTLNNLR